MDTTRVVDLNNNGIVVMFEDNQIESIKLPSGYVNYSFMPLIDQHLIVAGDKLQNGMVVVLADNRFREDPSRLNPENSRRASDYERHRVLETSRWALVTDLNVHSTSISFTAIYADGTMAARSGYNTSIKWAVLKAYEFSAVGDKTPCGICGTFHEEVDASIDYEGRARTIADDPSEQPAYDLLDSTAALVGAILYPEASRAERIQNVKDSMSGSFTDIFNSFFGSVEDDVTAEAPVERPQRPGETDDEYADRLRDEDEIAGEYDASEKAKFKREAKQAEDLARLRESLLGGPRQ